MKKTILITSLTLALCGSTLNAGFWGSNSFNKRSSCNSSISKKLKELTLVNNFGKDVHFTIFDKCGNVLFDKIVENGQKFNIIGKLKDKTLGDELIVCVGGKFYKTIKTEASKLHINDCIGNLVVSKFKAISCNMPCKNGEKPGIDRDWLEGFKEGLINGQEDVCNLNSFDLNKVLDEVSWHNKVWKEGYIAAYTKSFKLGCNFQNPDKSATSGQLKSLTLENLTGRSVPVLVKDEFGNVLFDDYVENGQTFVVNAADDEKLFGDKITIDVYGRNVATIPTECDKLEDNYNGFKVVNKECSGDSCNNKIPLPSCDSDIVDGVKSKADCISKTIAGAACDTLSKVKEKASELGKIGDSCGGDDDDDDCDEGDSCFGKPIKHFKGIVGKIGDSCGGDDDDDCDEGDSCFGKPIKHFKGIVGKIGDSCDGDDD